MGRRLAHHTSRGYEDTDTLDLSADDKSKWFSLWPRDLGSIEVDWTGLDAADGVWHLEVINAKEPVEADVGKPLLDSAGATYTITTSSTPGGWVFDVVLGARFVRLVWTANSTTAGTATVIYTSKNRGR